MSDLRLRSVVPLLLLRVEDLTRNDRINSSSEISTVRIERSISTELPEGESSSAHNFNKFASASLMILEPQLGDVTLELLLEL